MFRLPHEYFPRDRLQSFSSTFISGRSLAKKYLSSQSIKHKSRSLPFPPDNHETKIRVRPHSSQIRTASPTKSTFHGRKNDQPKFDQETLISPCNKKLKYFASELNPNSMNSRMTSSNFLLEPCKIESIPIKPRKSLGLQSFQSNCLQFSPCGSNKMKTGTHRIATAKSKGKNVRQNIKAHHPLKNEQLLQPWESADCYFQSIRLQPKNI